MYMKQIQLAKYRIEYLFELKMSKQKISNLASENTEQSYWYDVFRQ